MSNISKRRREGSRAKIKTMGDHKEFLKRITKTLYYGQLPTLPCLSLPVTDVSCWAWSLSQRGRSLRRLHGDAAARIARSACVSPCALVLAVLYLERLRTRNPDYLANAHPNELFLVSLMVGNKFLQDDGEDDEVICSEWAASGGLELRHLKKLEVEFLSAIDWNIFVSSASFEEGLRWLEKQVAWRQSAAHGFFTYTDLAVTCDAALAGALARALAAAAAACLAAAAAYALVLCAALASLPSLPSALQSLETTNLRVPDRTDLPISPAATNEPNSTDEERAAALSALMCERWAQYRKWTDAETIDPVLPDVSPDAWLRPTVLSWLYRSSLVNPLQRWLERLAEYAELVQGGAGGCPRRLGPERLHLGALLVAVSDR